jgi:hypothetical protein
MDTQTVNDLVHNRSPLLQTLQWQGGKQGGGLSRRESGKYFRVNIKGKETTFSDKKYGGTVQARAAASAFLWNEVRREGLIRNQYAFLVLPDGTRVGIVQLKHDKNMLFSEEDLPFVEMHIWSDHENNPGHWQVWATPAKNTHVLFHRLIFPESQVVDHRNRVSLDNRRCNLFPTTHAGNSMNLSMRIDNKSGINGVYASVDTRGKRFWAAARNLTVNGKKKRGQRQFYVHILGEEGAKAAATASRRAWDAEHGIRNGYEV